MADTLDYTADRVSDADLWENKSPMFNMTNTSSVYTHLLSPVMDTTINILLIMVVFITMVSLGCTMEVSKIKVTAAAYKSIYLKYII